MKIKLKQSEKEEIKQLVSDEKYDLILEKYGKYIFSKYTPLYYVLSDTYNLYKAGRFIDIQNKYGNSMNSLLRGLYLYHDILENSDNKLFANLKKNFYYLKMGLKGLISYYLIIYSSLIIMFPIYSHSLIKENEKKYAQEIEEYNDYLDEYINNLEIENKTDLEIVMTLVNDMWNSIEGYKTPELDVDGFYRLDILNGYGVCRNMADDITTKLNAINPEYNARNLVVDSTLIDYNPANVNIVNLMSQAESEEERETLSSKIEDAFLGNHLVTLVDIPDRNITLVIDSTNGGIGVLKNGKIVMFNERDSIYAIKEGHNYLQNGLENTIDLMERKISSFFVEESIDELDKEYGLDAQNKALLLK